MKNCLTILTIVLLSSCYVGEELPPDQQVWAYDLPAHHGVSESLLKVLDSQITSREYAQINSLMIIRNDRMIFENYYNGHARDTIQKIGRATNVVTMLTLGALLEDGLIPNLDVPIKDYLPEYADIFEEEESKKLITIRHLLHHSSGLPWDEYVVNPELFKSDYQLMRTKDDWARHVLNQPLEASPGLRIVLNSAGSLLLSRIFQNILDRTMLADYIDERIFQPIGISKYNWEYDPSHTLNLARGLSISTIDLTRLGYLMLLEGRWSDKRRIIDRDWVLDCLEPHTQFSREFDLGYGWWVFSESFVNQTLQAHPTYLVTGALGQNLYLVPEQNMVITIMGDNHFSHQVYNQSLRVYIQCLTAIQSNTVADI